MTFALKRELIFLGTFPPLKTTPWDGYIDKIQEKIFFTAQNILIAHLSYTKYSLTIHFIINFVLGTFESLTTPSISNCVNY